MKKFNFVIGCFNDELEGSIKPYNYGKVVFYGNSDDAIEIKKFVQERANKDLQVGEEIKEYHIFKLVKIE